MEIVIRYFFTLYNKILIIFIALATAVLSFMWIFFQDNIKLEMLVLINKYLNLMQ